MHPKRPIFIKQECFCVPDAFAFYRGNHASFYPQKQPKVVIFYKTDFLDLKYPPEVQVEPKTCIAIFRTPVPAILNHTNLTGLAGGAREGQNIAHLGHINAPTVPYFDLPLPLLPTRSNFYGSKWLVQVS